MPCLQAARYMDAAAFGGQVACEEAWAARALERVVASPILSPVKSRCTLIYEEPCSETAPEPPGCPAEPSGCSETFPAVTSGAGASPYPATGPAASPRATGPATLGPSPPATGPAAFSPPPPVGVSDGDACMPLPRLHTVQGIRSGKFVFKGSEEVMSIVNVQLVG